MYPESNRINNLVDTAKRVVIIQADNPDGDSLGSALALEEILSDLGKSTYLYCSVDIPDYLKHIQGWDRVNKDLPSHFDISIIVDTSAIVLLEKLEQSAQRRWVASKPVIVLDHHAGVHCDIPYASIVLNDADAVATGEVVYWLANELRWPINLQAKTHITSAILADSLGLSSEGTTPRTYRIIADLLESGVNRTALEEARRAFTKMPQQIFHYKSQLIQRTEFYADDRLALVVIPHKELIEFSPLYNPAPLIQPDMLQTEQVQLAIVIKHYNDGKILGSIRANTGAAIAAKLAEYFGGGGHVFAAGFKTNDKSLEDVKSTLITKAKELLDNKE
ncbi:MAG TPA: DHH family phosphoesterase [Candidatus Saccharimonadales bacterium]|nr:DHH family phosphoesterase [Candidatus Saccharimonadales bacterium]